ncbi:MAG: 4-alpha-glucanotransferase [Streptosporangiales bacterium]|nr:4-alpha-glucanotransferase [Streptosporangiales bacterium]
MAVGTADTELRRLARAYRVETGYQDFRRRQVSASADTLVAVLAALGVDASTPGSVRAELERVEAERGRRMLPPTVVIRASTLGRDLAETFEPRSNVSARSRQEGQFWVEAEDGTGDELPHGLPHDLPLGYHRIHARYGGREESAPLVVVPDRLDPPPALADGRVWGFMVQLYSVRSRRSWGLGDLRDLAELARWSGRDLGAGMVAINPLHAAEPVPPMEPSPYLPSSRRFANPIYLRIEDVPEYLSLPRDERSRVEALAAPLRARNATLDLLDRDACWAAKRAALELLHSVPTTPERRAAYEAFRAREGTALVDFAAWCALADEHGPVWRRWPAELHDPRSPAVAAAGDRLAGRIDFHCWLQWLLDEQLGHAQREAREAGMPVGIVHDLAVGVNPGGADAWLLQDVLASGASTGAPPDAFNQQGQDWAQPPWHPYRLAEAGYAPYRDLLRYTFRHAGGLRVDHILGLFRLWWVPEGAPPSAGTYVRYDHEALVGILALEAYRAGGLVVGEDLGTVEPWVRDYLSSRGLLGTSMLWFERDRDGRPRRPERWRKNCLATVATHDLPPIAAYLTGEHVELRHRLGLLDRPVDEERAEAGEQVRGWLALLTELGLLGPEPDGREIVEALHAFLARTPARLVGVSLADAVGERRTQNQPGTVDEYPNWRVPLASGDGRPVGLEDLRKSGDVRRLARIITDRLH